jgi:hypothetical protein
MIDELRDRFVAGLLATWKNHVGRVTLMQLTPAVLSDVIVRFVGGSR